ncbi:unnamed protein product [Leptidea sinapis]|uniref:Regulation of nuclear pre-mRNA domain-containing protein 2 n=1 Tax=Leptidea sinapis TaxID=189913 RepID=A0A5E4Q825_9NEOP|nr:unnamed protein product [Leptidea sinapis]
MGETEEFNPLVFEKKLSQLKDTQESIQSLSSWCLKQRNHHKKIVSSWLNVLKRVKVEQRLVLFYLANDVIQYSKRKNYEFVESWGLNLQKATPLVRDEKVRTKILRIFKIWEQRSVYDEEFLSDLTGLLIAGAVKKTDDDLDFQPQQLINKIKQCVVLEADTDLRLQQIHECSLDLSDADTLCINLKERSNKDDVSKEINEGIGCIERYTQALQREIVAREALHALLSSANQYYATQRGEVKVVAYAYKNFGARVRALKRKLDDLIPTLPSATPSPPARDEDVPSPGPDEDLDLPPQEQEDEGNENGSYNIDQTFNSTVSADGSLYNLGLSSFLTSDNPLTMFNDAEIDLSSANKIEVINTRPGEKQDFSINDFLKTLTPVDTITISPDTSVSSAKISANSQDALPGLDLLTPEGSGNPPPPSFYGSIDAVINISDEPEHHYLPEAIVSSQWTTNNWSVPPVSSSAPLNVFAEPPASPPPSVMAPTIKEHVAVDVDHRAALPPPPPPPALPMLTQLEDVDQRLLPPPAISPVVPHRGSSHQDVDHRNLISLTHEMPARTHIQANLDQDYRVPPLLQPTDIVESVDMDLSEDEDQHGMYPNKQNQVEHRRNSFNNNKVLVGGGEKVRNNSGNFVHTNNTQTETKDAIIPPLSNPFDKMPSNLKFNMPLPFNNENKTPLLHPPPPNLPPNHNLNTNLPPTQGHPSVPLNQNMPPNLPLNQNLLTKLPLNSNLHPNLPPNHNLHSNLPANQNLHPNLPPHQNLHPNVSQNMTNFLPNNQNTPIRHMFNSNYMDKREENSNDSTFEDNMRTRSVDYDVDHNESDWNQSGPRHLPRYPRNWTPRTNYRPNVSPQFWPRNGPRTPNRWMGPPQRFW